MKRRSASPAYREALMAARRDKLEQRARLIGAGIVESKTKRKNKYNRVKVTTIYGQFDSIGEAEYAAKLELRRLSGDILRWERAKSFILVDADRARDRVTYTPDFEVWPMPVKSINGTINKTPSVGKTEVLLPKPYYVDFKGSSINKKTGKRRTPTQTQAFAIRVKLWRKEINFELRVAYSDGVEKILVEAHTIS